MAIPHLSWLQILNVRGLAEVQDIHLEQISICLARCDPWGVWPIYLQNWVVLGVNVGKYIEHLGFVFERNQQKKHLI